MRRLDEEGLRNEGDWIEWDIFYDLKVEGHIVCGAECHGGLEPDTLDLVEKIRDISRNHSRNAMDAEGEDFEDLEKDFDEILGLINAIRGNDELRSQQYLSLAAAAREFMESNNPELLQYGSKCQNMIIISIPGNTGEPLHADLRAFFHLDIDQWMNIRARNQ